MLFIRMNKFSHDLITDIKEAKQRYQQRLANKITDTLQAIQNINGCRSRRATIGCEAMWLDKLNTFYTLFDLLN